MVRPKGYIDIDIDPSSLKLNNKAHNLNDEPKPELNNILDNQYNHISNDFSNNEITIKKALIVITQQMEINGLRDRTIKDYNYQFKRFAEMVNVEYLSEINTDKIYEFLVLLGNIKDISRLNRLKTVSAVLSRCYDNRWLETKFWTSAKIIVDKTIKRPTEEKELSLLLSLLDTTIYAGFRDSVAVLLLYKTGIRINTLGLLKEEHIDFKNKILELSGDIMKSHRTLKLPLDDNNFIFLTSHGTPINDTVSPANLISKNLWKYSKRYGFKKIMLIVLGGYTLKILLNVGQT